MNENEIESKNIDMGDDEDETQISPPELVQLMEESWLNEKFSPEILPHKTDIVELLLGQLAYVEENLKKLKSTDFKRGLHQMEVERLKFLIASYLRLRIEKIETYSTHILEQERLRAQKEEDMYLNQNELVFAQEYELGLRQHMDSIMNFCPELTDTQLITPNLHSVVFVKSKEDVEGIVVEEGTGDDTDLIDLARGSQVLVSYAGVANLVKKGDVHLI